MAVDRDPADEPERTPDELLARAAGSLREITDDGWVRARASVLDRVRRTLRPSPHVAGRHAGGRFTVATTVLADRVRRAVEDDGTARVLELVPDTGPDDELVALALALSVPYGASVAGAAAAARSAVVAEVRRTLGTTIPPDRVTVDLHVADVHRVAGEGPPVSEGR